jgi:hypothetical protein
MDIDGYRQLQQRLLLTASGQVPVVPLDLSREEQEAALDRISRVWQFIEQYPASGQQPSAPLLPTAAETWAGLKRWFLSHHLFIPTLALTGHCLTEAVQAMRGGLRERVQDWVRLASRLRKGCGSLFLYGLDFKPCVVIYCGAIRSNMPPAFSGFWIREREHCFQPALVSFFNTFPLHTADDLCERLRNDWAIADQRYHELHERAMLLAVPNGKSLADIYRDETGKCHRITEQEFEHYDTWFCIERSPDLTRLDYIFQVCDVAERVVADLMVGQRLETAVLTELLDGIKAAIVVFGRWVGPVPEPSRYYPKCLRGE